VKQKANGLADHLENEGVISKEGCTRHVWESISPGKLCADCLCQVAKDMELFQIFSSEKKEDWRKVKREEILGLQSFPRRSDSKKLLTISRPLLLVSFLRAANLFLYKMGSCC